MFFPLKDDNSKRRSIPLVNWLIVGGCMITGILQVKNGQSFTYALSLVPAELTTQTDLKEDFMVETEEGRVRIPHFPALVPLWVTLFSSLFLHGSFMHFLGNMWFLSIFGDQIEDLLGHIRYLIFYLSCGALAGLSHVVMDPHSAIHTIGASGAVSGVLAAYLLVHPGNRITVLVSIIPLRLPALLVIGFWFLGQIGGVLQPAGDGVAYMAHIGGFAAGFIMLRVVAPERAGR